MTGTTTVEDLLRTLAPRVLAVLVRRHGQFDACEDAVQEALLAAAMQWPAEGVPAEPAGWLVTVAGRRLTDQWRSESARRRRETAVAVRAALPRADHAVDPADELDRPAERRHAHPAVPVLPPGAVRRRRRSRSPCARSAA